jgi:hypothetical protein
MQATESLTVGQGYGHLGGRERRVASTKGVDEVVGDAGEVEELGDGRHRR